MKIFKVAITLIIASAPIATAKTFESLARTTSTLRLPASAIKEAVEFDCASKQQDLKLSTNLETIRVIGKNCPLDMTVMQTEFQQQLHAFSAVEEGSMTSEYAYLRKGENQFEIHAGKKSIKLKIFRY